MFRPVEGDSVAIINTKSSSMTARLVEPLVNF